MTRQAAALEIEIGIAVNAPKNFSNQRESAKDIIKPNQTKPMNETTQEPQTVYFKAKFLFDRIPRTRETEELVFDSLELMILTYRKARRCRAIADRPTSGLYKMELTQLGKELCASDPYLAERHEMVGKNFFI